jgi:DNA-binding NarL/FixJ family response regulator
MIRVYISTARPEERAALRLMLLDLNVQVVGESADWFTTLAKAPATNFNILLIDWDILPMNAATGLSEIRRACSYAVIIVLTSQQDALKQEALAGEADAFISRSEIPTQLAERLRPVVETIENESMH